MRERVIVADPGFLRLRSATRGTLIVGVCFLVLYRFSEYLHQPITLAFIGALIGMMGNLAVNDATVENQKRTVAAVTVTALIAVLVGAVLAPWHQLSLAVFIGLVFLAVFLRRYGPRGSAIGLTVFMAYFCTFIFPLPLATLPLVAGTLLLTGAMTYLIRFGVIRDRPERIHGWTLIAYRYALGRLFADLAAALKAGESTPVKESLFQSRLTTVHELAFLLDETVAGGDQAQLWSGARLRALQGALFESEISSRRAVDSVIGELETRGWTAKERADWIHGLEEESAILLDETRDFKETRQAPGLFVEFESAARVLFDRKPERRSVGEAARLAPGPAAPPADIDLNLRQAIQATLATGFATALGTLVSSQRWYWASVTSFVLFAGATRGETLRRGFHRLWGTFLGLVIGVVIAWVFAGRSDWELTLVFLCIFGGLYTVRSASYAWPTMWFSLMVALFFSLLGQMNRQIFLLRLEQTLIGVVAGGLCAALVLPVSTRGQVRASFRALLGRVAETLDELARDEGRIVPRRERRERVRTLERQLAALRALAGPLRGGFGLAPASDVETFLHAATALVHYTRQLAIFLSDQAIGEDSAAVRDALLGLATRARLVAAVTEPPAEAPPPAPPAGESPGPVFTALRGLSEVLAALEKRPQSPP